MAEDKEWEKFHKKMKYLKGKFVASLKQKDEFIKHKKQKIKEDLNLFPVNAIQNKYNYLVEERQKNLKMKTDYEIRKKLDDRIWFTYIPEAYDEVNEHIADLISLYKKLLPLKNESQQPTNLNPHSLKLSDIFEINTKYHYIMNLLVEEGYCQPVTFLWKDDKKGNKGMLAAIIKYLHLQGYFKDNSRITNEQIMQIARNTFGIELAMDTIKKSNPANFKLDFIPSASSIL